MKITKEQRELLIKRINESVESDVVIQDGYKGSVTYKIKYNKDLDIDFFVNTDNEVSVYLEINREGDRISRAIYGKHCDLIKKAFLKKWGGYIVKKNLTDEEVLKQILGV